MNDMNNLFITLDRNLKNIGIILVDKFHYLQRGESMACIALLRKLLTATSPKVIEQLTLFYHCNNLETTSDRQLVKIAFDILRERMKLFPVITVDQFITEGYPNHKLYILIKLIDFISLHMSNTSTDIKAESQPNPQTPNNKLSTNEISSSTSPNTTIALHPLLNNYQGRGVSGSSSKRRSDKSIFTVPYKTRFPDYLLGEALLDGEDTGHHIARFVQDPASVSRSNNYPNQSNYRNVDHDDSDELNVDDDEKESGTIHRGQNDVDGDDENSYMKQYERQNHHPNHHHHPDPIVSQSPNALNQKNYHDHLQMALPRPPSNTSTHHQATPNKSHLSNPSHKVPANASTQQLDTEMEIINLLENKLSILTINQKQQFSELENRIGSNLEERFNQRMREYIRDLIDEKMKKMSIELEKKMDLKFQQMITSMDVELIKIHQQMQRNQRF